MTNLSLLYLTQIKFFFIIALFWVLLEWLLLTFSLCKTPMRTWLLKQLLLFTYWLPKHPVFWFTTLFPTQSVRPPLATYSSLCSTSVNCRMLCLNGHQALPTQSLSREADYFPSRGNHSKHVPLLTFLVWLQPIYCNPGFLKLINIFARGKKFGKKT